MQLDAGCGDGRRLLRAARRQPGTLFIGLDADAGPLKPAARAAARKPARGGTPNAAFVAGAAEALPGPLANVADAITVYLPWGSLLAAVLGVDGLARLRHVARPGATFEAVVSHDPQRDGLEWERLGLRPDLAEDGLRRTYGLAGWDRLRCNELSMAELRNVGTTWAKRLAQSPGRRAWRIGAVAG